MFNGEEDKPHDRQEEGSYAEFKIDFEVTEDDDGNLAGAVASIQSHIHHVPVHALIDALLMMSKGLLADHMTEMVRIPDGAPEALRAHMLDAFAGVFLKQRLDSDDLRGATMAVITVPNDISELLD